MTENATTTVEQNNNEQRTLLTAPPRDPSAIHPTEHFLRRFSNDHGHSSETRRDPEITGDVIEACIRDGDVRPGNGDSLLYETHVDGYDWRLVVGFNDAAPVVVTAYVPGVHDKRGGFA